MKEEKIVVPEVNVVSGFKVECTDPKCGPIGFERKKIAAGDMKAAHIERHRELERKRRKYAEELVAAQAETGAVSIARLMCPTCQVSVGEEHHEQCDVARCMTNGGQRLLQAHIPVDANASRENYLQFDKNHDCGRDIWTGFFPGEKEAIEYGVPLNLLKSLGYWDAKEMRWALPEGWEKLPGAGGLVSLPSE